MRPIAMISATFVVLAIGMTGASAHALLDRAEPRVGNTVQTPPREMKLWFTEKLERAFSTVTVTDASGQRVDTGKPQVSGNQLSVPLRALNPGIYRVNWHVLSVDSHRTDGNFTFTVGK